MHCSSFIPLSTIICYCLSLFALVFCSPYISDILLSHAPQFFVSWHHLRSKFTYYWCFGTQTNVPPTWLCLVSNSLMHPQALETNHPPKDCEAKMNDSTNGFICVMCNQPATQQCTICKSQIYCGKECQKPDWRVHKLLCSSYQQFLDPPGEHARRAIVFEQDEPVIRFKWIETKHIDVPDDSSFEIPILDEYFEPKDSDRELYNKNPIRGRHLRNTITLWARECFLMDGSPPNQAVAAIAPAVWGKVWCGPLIALKWDARCSKFSSNPSYTHMEMGDLRDVVDYLVDYGQPSCSWWSPAPRWPCNCMYWSHIPVRSPPA